MTLTRDYDAPPPVTPTWLDLPGPDFYFSAPTLFNYFERRCPPWQIFRANCVNPKLPLQVNANLIRVQIWGADSGLLIAKCTRTFRKVARRRRETFQISKTEPWSNKSWLAVVNSSSLLPAFFLFVVLCAFTLEFLRNLSGVECALQTLIWPSGGWWVFWIRWLSFLMLWRIILWKIANSILMPALLSHNFAACQRLGKSGFPEVIFRFKRSYIFFRELFWVCLRNVEWHFFTFFYC